MLTCTRTVLTGLKRNKSKLSSYPHHYIYLFYKDTTKNSCNLIWKNLRKLKLNFKIMVTSFCIYISHVNSKWKSRKTTKRKSCILYVFSKVLNFYYFYFSNIVCICCSCSETKYSKWERRTEKKESKGKIEKKRQNRKFLSNIHRFLEY